MMDTLQADFHDPDWVTTRRFINEPEIFGSPDSYLDILPTFHGQTIQDILKDKTDESYSRYLDLGGGSAIAAVGVHKRFPPDKLDITVIGHTTDTEKPFKLSPRELEFREPSKYHLTENHINFNHLDFTQITPHDEATLGRFDVISAVYSVTWMKQNKYELIQKVYKLLKPNGVAFITTIGIRLDDPTSYKSESAFQYLNKEYGFDFQENSGGVAFSRVEGKDELPNIFEPVGIGYPIQHVKLFSKSTKKA